MAAGAVYAVTIACLSGCTASPTRDLATAVQGMQKAQFLRCAGPPILTSSSGGQEHMSFVTDLKRGAPIGNSSPTALPPASCSVDTVFQNDRLLRADFSGDMSMCNLVFGPCL